MGLKLQFSVRLIRRRAKAAKWFNFNRLPKSRR